MGRLVEGRTLVTWVLDGHTGCPSRLRPGELGLGWHLDAGLPGQPSQAEWPDWQEN